MSLDNVRTAIVRASTVISPLLIVTATIVAFAFRNAGVVIPGVALAAFIGVTIVYGAFRSTMALSVANSALGCTAMALFLSSDRLFAYHSPDRLLLTVVTATFPAVALIIGLMRLESERMQEQLMAAERMWQLLAAEMPNLVVTMSDDGRVYYTNHALPWLPPTEDPKGRKLSELLPTSAQDGFEKTLRRVWSSGEEVRTEIPLILADATALRYDVRVHRVMQDHEAMALIASFVDVSDRQVEEDAHERLAAVVNASNSAIFGMQVDGTIVGWNPGGERMYGYREDEIVGKQLSALFPEGRSEAEASPFLEAAARGKQTERAEMTHRRKDGTAIRVAMSLAPIMHHGTVTGISAIARDLTTERRVEDERLRTLALLAEAEKIARVGSWEWDLASDRMAWTDGLFHIYGYDPGAVKPDLDAYLRSIEPTDRERVHKAIGTARSGGGPFTFDQRILRDDGMVRILRVHGALQEDLAGRPARLIGTVQDVTEQRALEAELEVKRRALEAEMANHVAMLRDTRLQLDTVLKNAPVVLWSHDMNGILNFVGGNALASIGLSSEALVGTPIFALFKDHPELITEVRKVLAGKPVRTRTVFLGRTFEATGVPLRDDAGTVVGAIGFALDASGLPSV